MTYQFKTYAELRDMTRDALQRLTMQLDQRVAKLETDLELAIKASAEKVDPSQVEEAHAEIARLRNADGAKAIAELAALKEARAVEVTAAMGRLKSENAKLKERLAVLEGAEG